MGAKNAILAILILQSLGVLSTELKGCPKDWKRFENSCYMSPSATADWYSSQANCSQYNAHLVSISSEHENSFLIREIVRNTDHSHFWIGLKRTPFDYSVWAWVDGSPMTFTDWKPWLPDGEGYGEGCAELYSSGSSANWNDLNCSAWKLRFICEKDDFGAGEGCAELYTKGNNAHWNDQNCRKNLTFICKKVLTADLPTCSHDNGGCPHLCLSTFSGPRCKCKDGFISEKDGAVCLDPKMFMSQEAQRQTVHLFDVALLIFQLLSFILLIPVSYVLVSFYRRVSNQRRLKAQQTIMINSPSFDDEHGLENQTSPLTNPDSSCENENISDVQV